MMDLLLGDDQTISLERFLAGAVLAIGILALTPWWPLIGSNTLLEEHFPRWAMAAILIIHGTLYVWSLVPPYKMAMCRRAALITAAMFFGATVTFVPMPPHDLFLVPITSALGTAAFLVYLRLGLLFR